MREVSPRRPDESRDGDGDEGMEQARSVLPIPALRESQASPRIMHG